LLRSPPTHFDTLGELGAFGRLRIFDRFTTIRFTDRAALAEEGGMCFWLPRTSNPLPVMSLATGSGGAKFDYCAEPSHQRSLF
jgi:hypothetical protein